MSHIRYTSFIELVNIHVNIRKIVDVKEMYRSGVYQFVQNKFKSPQLLMLWNEKQ